MIDATAQIHPTAVVHYGAYIRPGVVIRPYAVIGENVRIYDNAYIGEYAAIGTPPEVDGFYPAGGKEALFGVEIGNGVVVREHSRVQSGSVMDTRVDARAHVMAGVHIAHDCVIGEEAIISPGALLGGFTLIGSRANLGIGSATHPWTLVGSGAMVGLNSSVIRDVLPFQKVAGSPSRVLGSNQHNDASLPAEYDATRVNEDAWREWNYMLDLREQQRVAWSNR